MSNNHEQAIKKQVQVARAKYMGYLPPAQLDFKIYKYLSQAQKTYDPKKGNFSSHLSMYMNKLHRDVHESMSNLGVGEHLGNSLHKMQKAYDEYVMRYDKEPTIEDLARLTNLPAKFVAKHIDKIGKKMVISRDQFVAPMDIKADELMEPLNNEEREIAKAGLGLGKRPKNMPRSTFFRRLQQVKDKMRQHYLMQNTIVAGD